MSREKGSMSSARIMTGSIIAALVGAIAVFIVMLQIEKSALSQYEKEIVYVAAKEIPRGQLLNSDNMQDYLVERELKKTDIPAAAIKSREQLLDMTAVFDIEEGVFLTGGMFETRREITKDMQEPIIASIRVDDLSQVAGGILRPGDRIHIYQLDREGEVTSVWEDIYVYQVFDYSGNQIPCEDKNAAAQRMNVFLDKDSMETFYTQLITGSLYAVKVL